MTFWTARETGFHNKLMEDQMRAMAWSMILAYGILAVAYGEQPAANPMPPAAQEVLERMDKEIAIAKSKAATSLDKILKDTTKKGDLQGALAVKAAMEKLQRESRPGNRAGRGSAFVGRWVGQGWTTESFPDGTIVFSNGVKGLWSENGDAVHIECENGDVHDIVRSGDGYSGAYTAGPGKGMKLQYQRANGPQ